MHFSYGFINNHLCNNLFISRLKNMYFSCQEKYIILCASGPDFWRCGEGIFRGCGVITDDRRLVLVFLRGAGKGRKYQFAAAAGRVAVAEEVLSDKVAKITRWRFGVAEIKL